MSQTSQILAYLKTGASLTPLEALERFGCFRLGARIWELRDEKYDIRMELVGGKKHYARYTLVTKVEADGQMVMV